jgi:hypothetical protein
MPLITDVVVISISSVKNEYSFLSSFIRCADQLVSISIYAEICALVVVVSIPVKIV